MSSVKKKKKGLLNYKLNLIWNDLHLTSSYSSFAIGVHKHGKNAVKVIATSPLFSVTERHVDDAKRELDPSIVEQDFDSTRSALTERFGSVKRRRELRSQEASKFDVDSHSGSAQAAQSALDSAAATVPTSEETDAERALLPPYDALTTDESKIYKFSDMVPTTLWRALPTKPLINPMQSREELSDMYPSFVIMNLDRIKTLEGEEQRQVSRLLMYFNFLMRMYREHRTDTLAYNIACDPELGEFLAQTFTGTSKGRITKEHKAKIIAHLCVIALNASDSCQVDGEEIQSIATDLKLTVSELLPYFRAVGCPNASKMRCKLVAPLKLPDVGGFKSRRG